MNKAWYVKFSGKWYMSDNRSVPPLHSEDWKQVDVEDVCNQLDSIQYADLYISAQNYKETDWFCIDPDDYKNE